MNCDEKTIWTFACGMLDGYLGRSRARLLWIARDGAVVSERTLSKLRSGERGARYAYEQFIAKGGAEDSGG
jgi:hypothetical protein